LIVHQLGSVLARGDAVTNHIVEIDRRLTRWGLATRIYGADIAAAPTDKAQLDREYVPCLENTDDLLLYHYSAYCENYELFRRSRNRKVLIYHNITPAEFYHPYDAVYESLCDQGRRLLPQLVECDLALGVSEYNRDELVVAGFAADRLGVLPLFLGVQDFDQAPRVDALYRQLKTGGTANILFVGKVAPNKAFEDLIKIFSAYHRHTNPNSRLILVGARFVPRYDRVVDRLVARLGLKDAVIFTDRVRLAELKTYYQAADLFLCASRHEGFCAPLLEAMYFDAPILAREMTAIPTTLGRAGVRFRELDYPRLAEMMQILVEDSALRRQVIATQRARLADFAPERVEACLQDALCRVGVTVGGE
jgi:glycosyltransferase involved in cell wall biosynthesis